MHGCRRRTLLAALIAAAVPAAAAAVPAAASAAQPGVTATGNVLVLLDRGRVGIAAAQRAVRSAAAHAGGRPAGRSVPQIGLITMRPPAGTSPVAFAKILRRLRGVASVELEHRYVPRSIPDDPALSAPSPYSGVVQWALAREGFYSAWNITRGDGALVGVVDTGIDASHPDLRSKIAAAVNDQGLSDATGTARTDEVGHGTHVASLACADTNNGIGMAGAGYNCKLVIEKSDFSDSSIAAAIVDAADRHVQAINMSFGPDTSHPPPAPQSEVRALDYAASLKVVLVAAAADSAGTEQGDPANVVQPAGTGHELTRGLGLDVTAAGYAGQRASFAGYGSEISLAAYGAFEPDDGVLGSGPPPGLFGAFPAKQTELEAPPDPCECRTTFDGSDSYAYLEGTSMAAPQVAATAAMMRALNPYASLRDILTILKQTAQRPARTGWRASLGWGILDAGAALAATRVLDRLAPVARIFAPRVAHHLRFTVRWSGHDGQHRGLVASGIARFLVSVRTGDGRWHQLVSTRKHSLRYRCRPRRHYEFEVVAIDRAGNREHPAATTSTRVAAGAR